MINRVCVCCLVALALTWGSAQTDPEFQSPRTASYTLSEVEGSGVDGTLQITERLSGGTTLTVSLQGVGRSGGYALELFRGDCGPDREPVTRLETLPNIPGDPFGSLTESELAFDELTGGDYFLYVYLGSDAADGLAACGEVGANANASGFPEVTRNEEAGNAAADPVNADPVNPEFVSPRTASYYLAPLEGGTVSAQLQITENIAGGSRLTVSLSPEAEGRYSVTLFEGDCGPDRPPFAELSSTDVGGAEAGVNVTESDLAFAQVAEADLFAYLYREGEPIACGEVGLGANR